MKTADFIKTYCIGATCQDFDDRYGCRAYDGEECDEAFTHPRWRGLKMADRVSRLCEKRHKERDNNADEQQSAQGGNVPVQPGLSGRVRARLGSVRPAEEEGRREVSDKHKTIADIVAEKRRRAAAIRADLSTVPVRRDDQLAEAEELETEAGLIEAAHERELAEVEASALEVGGIVEAMRRKRKTAGNAAAIREALENIASNLARRLFARDRSSAPDEWMWQKAMSALSKPARNCDVGTAEEQAERFKAYCGQEVCKRASCQFHAKASFIYACAIAWAQMPYEGKAKEGGEK